MSGRGKNSMSVRCPNCNRFRSLTYAVPEHVEATDIVIKGRDVFASISGSLEFRCSVCGNDLAYVSFNAENVRVGDSADIEPCGKEDS